MDRLTRGIRGFGAFWWEFVVGDDWRVAVGVVVALAVTGALAHRGIASWWLMPVAAVTLLSLSLWGAATARHP